MHGIYGVMGEGPGAAVALGCHVVHKLVQILPLSFHSPLEPDLARPHSRDCHRSADKTKINKKIDALMKLGAWIRRQKPDMPKHDRHCHHEGMVEPMLPDRSALITNLHHGTEWVICSQNELVWSSQLLTCDIGPQSPVSLELSPNPESER